MKTKIAILGVGRWGVHWVRNLITHPQAEVVAIIDPNPERLALCRSQLLPASSNILLATTWDDARNVEGLEAVVISTPASSHYHLIKDALELKYHILAEKPLTLDVAQCLELCELAQRQQRELFVDHTYLFHPTVVKGQEVVKSGNLGQLRYGYAARTNLGPVRHDVDALWDLAIHDIAIFNYWLGESPITVQATGKSWLQTGLNDVVWLNLSYPSGFSATIHVCWSNPDKQRRLVVVGNQGSLIFDEMSSNQLVLQKGYFEREGSYFVPDGLSQEVIAVTKDEPLRKVCDRFLTHIQSSSFSNSASEGTKLVQILAALTESLAENGKIVNI